MLKISQGSEPAFEAAKWLALQLLVSKSEMQQLMESLGKLQIFQASGVCLEGYEEIPLEKFLEAYATYCAALEAGEVPDFPSCTSIFTSFWTLDENCLYLKQVGSGKYLVRVAKPVVQVLPLSLRYSAIDQKFRSMVHGQDAITWGLQFSFPQLFLDPVSKEVVMTIRDESKFCNMRLFKQLQKWQRNFTRPTPFIINESKRNESFRLGKEGFAWINNHYQLKNLHLTVAVHECKD